MPSSTAREQFRRRVLTAVARQIDIIRQPGEDFVKSRDNVSRMFDFAVRTEIGTQTAFPKPKRATRAEAP